jgi:predicted nicotinamide N-methyase
VRLFGGSLEGKRVLDLASNAGYWSLASIKAGANYVLDNEVDVFQHISELIRKGVSDPWARSRRSCLIDVIKTPPSKVSPYYISDWFVIETVANEDSWFLFACHHLSRRRLSNNCAGSL